MHVFAQSALTIQAFYRIRNLYAIKKNPVCYHTLGYVLSCLFELESLSSESPQTSSSSMYYNSVFLKQSKVEPFKQVAKVYLGATGRNKGSPTRILKNSQLGPLLITKEGKG